MKNRQEFKPAEIFSSYDEAFNALKNILNEYKDTIQKGINELLDYLKPKYHS